MKCANLCRGAASFWMRRSKSPLFVFRAFGTCTPALTSRVQLSCAHVVQAAVMEGQLVMLDNVARPHAELGATPRTQAAVYLGFAVFIVGWIMQAVVVFGVPYTPA